MEIDTHSNPGMGVEIRNTMLEERVEAGRETNGAEVGHQIALAGVRLESMVAEMIITAELVVGRLW